VRNRIRIRRFQTEIPTYQGAISDRMPKSNPEIRDLRVWEQSVDEAKCVGDFVSNRITSLDEITGNAVKMGLYRAAIQHFQDRIPANFVRLYVDAAIEAELSVRREVAAARRAQKRQREAA
jgi:hypothetical protein